MNKKIKKNPFTLAYTTVQRISHVTSTDQHLQGTASIIQNKEFGREVEKNKGSPYHTMTCHGGSKIDYYKEA